MLNTFLIQKIEEYTGQANEMDRLIAIQLEHYIDPLYPHHIRLGKIDELPLMHYLAKSHLFDCMDVILGKCHYALEHNDNTQNVLEYLISTKQYRTAYQLFIRWEADTERSALLKRLLLHNEVAVLHNLSDAIKRGNNDAIMLTMKILAIILPDQSKQRNFTQQSAYQYAVQVLYQTLTSVRQKREHRGLLLSERLMKTGVAMATLSRMIEEIMTIRRSRQVVSLSKQFKQESSELSELIRQLSDKAFAEMDQESDYLKKNRELLRQCKLQLEMSLRRERYTTIKTTPLPNTTLRLMR